MAKISGIDDFNLLVSNITSFSHVYLFDTNSLLMAFPYIESFAKRIICAGDYQDLCNKNCDICYQIDHDEFDDFYVVNPDTIGINSEEIEKLFNYMMTKSTRENGKRVYVIYGFERLSENVSNKLLKFLEEPNENIYGILLTENVDKILPTIISRCQIIKLSFDNGEIPKELIDNMKSFIKEIFNKENKIIAYENKYFSEILLDRQMMYNAFDTLENIVSNAIKVKCGENYNKVYELSILSDISLNKLINILDLTNHHKNLIKRNINLNLLLDRYIIEFSKELDLCKK